MNLKNIDCETNYIKETVCRIDKVQKDILNNGETYCISCLNSLLASANTIPVSFKTICGNPVEGNIGVTPTTTQFFRIESVRCCRFVTLRLLQSTGETLNGTDYTMILDLDTVGSIQCFEAVSVPVCTRGTDTTTPTETN